jgi:hypothetical protein
MIMITFLRGLMGTSPRSKAADADHQREMEELEKRDRELDELVRKMEEMSEAQKDKKEELSKTKIDLTTTLSTVPPKLCEVEKDDDRPSGEHAPPR